MDQFARIDLARTLAAATPLLDAFPGEMWIAHEIVEKSNGKLDKPPAPGFRTNDPSSWVTLGAAVAVAETYPVGAAGVGFIIVERLITFDFDDCIGADGEVVAEIATMIERLNSFSYRTVSGTGMRVICHNDEADPIPGCKRTRRTTGGYKVEIFIGPHNSFNTFSVETNGKPIAARGAVVRELLDELKARPPQRGEAGSNYGEFGMTSDLGKKARDQKALRSALKAFPHGEEIDRELWVKIGGGMYTGSGGSERGRAAFIAWSETWVHHEESPEEHTEAAEDLWDSFATSPPRAVGAGTIFELAKQHGWTWPKKATTAADEEHALERFVDVKIEPTQDFVEDLLEIDSLAMIFGPPGAGKTFFVLSLLIHVAWGQPWFGRDVEQGPALLFAREGRNGVRRRIVAFRQHHRLVGEDLPFAADFGTVDLSDPASVDQVIRAILAHGRAYGAPVKIAAIDTLASSLGSNGDENSAEVMNPVLANCHHIRQQTGCCLILVHHPGKNARMGPRGFSGIRGTLDTLIEIELPEDSKDRRVSVQKQRDLEIGADMFYRLKVVEIGIDPRRGKPITSCIVMPILDASEKATAAVRAKLAQLTKQQRMALDALREALREHGGDTPNGKPAARVTTMLAWRNALKERSPGSTATAIRQAHRRFSEAFLKAGLIGVKGEQIWLQEDVVKA